MPKEIGISNKDFGTYLKDDPSESKLPTNSFVWTLIFSLIMVFYSFFQLRTVESHNFVWLH